MDYHHNYGGMNGHDRGYGYGPRNGYGGPEIDQHSMDRFDNTRDMEPTFELDHLATYSSKSGVMKPEDGLRKLRGMESTTGIWTMRCVMIIERKNLIVIDKGNGEELERFPLELVHEPTAIFKEDKREVYTNLIMFTMLENPGKYSSRCDMHIFQSINAPAQDIVDELLAAKEGRPKLFQSSIPPPPMGPAPDPPEQSSRYQFKTTTLRDEGMKSNASNNGLRLQNEGFRVIPSSEGFRPPSEGFRTEPFRAQNEGPRGDMYSLPMRDKDSVNSGNRGGNFGQSQYRASYTEPPGGQNESLERDVQILNSCFDDIEKFVARLQQAAEAYKELENRKRERQSHKKKNDRAPPPRDGMLNMRARPPPGDDFIDIFQKIKCAFNLLSKLKAHIHDPNAPELVHFIFTPLSLIYEASRDPVHVGIDLASKAVAPLLTREAKELLLNCLTSKELELWQLLGRNWTTSEDEYPGHVEAFCPRFYNGWTPAPSSQQMIRQLPPPREEPRDDYRATRDNYGSTNYGRTQPEEPSYSRTRREEEPSYHTGPIGASSRIGQSFRPEEDDHYRREPMYDRKHPSTPPPGAVTNPNVAKYQEYVEKHIDRNQDAHRYSGGNKSRSQENQEYKEELRRKNAKIYEAVHERTGRNQKEITVEKGDILEVLDDSRNWWRLRNYKGDSGYAPYTILRDAGDDRNDIDRNGGRRGSIGGYSGNINQSNHIPVAPPPPRKDEEEFVREIKPTRHIRNDSDGRSDGSDLYRKGRRQDKRSSSSDPYGSRDDTPDSSDADNFSGSYDGSIEDRVERRRSNNKRNERQTSIKPALKNRNSGELKRAGESRGYQNRSFEEEPNRHRTRTPPPPPSFVPPPPPENRPPSASKKYNQPGQANKRQQDQLHNELSQRLSGKPAVKSKPQNPNVYLSTKSSAKEVVEWLYSKSFSQKCVDVLRGYNGHDLLRMKMKDLERLINHDEAQRLDGHLTLQKNMSGYKTQGPKELQAILQQRKQKADTHDDDVGRPPSFAPESPDYSDDNSEASEEDFGNAGKTLRALLQHQRKKITSHRYEQ
ncbi:epidermal growth factor receptor kinase substrate 8-like isoform X6 [Mytilus edulis]|uniref:epidermal growth factor receptor kinase substrate 8-like isoform X6 n=1 Tax=Mytilus edulis TaxID=6550 RepID=UPI0039EEF5AC